MNPSRSSLDRLPKAMSEKWEARRGQWESQLREQEQPPTEAAVLAVSLDGVMAPMKDGQRQDKRNQSRQQGKPTRGPAGFREVGCGTLSHYDGAGARLRTRRHARMPEPGKRSLKRQLVAEVENAFRQEPNLRLVKVADGARDNWDFLAMDLPDGVEVVDFGSSPLLYGRKGWLTSRKSCIDLGSLRTQAGTRYGSSHPGRDYGVSGAGYRAG